MKELLELLNESEMRQLDIDGLDQLPFLLLTFHLSELTFEQYIELSKLDHFNQLHAEIK